MIILDASAAIEWLLQTPAGIRIDKRIFSPQVPVPTENPFGGFQNSVTLLHSDRLFLRSHVFSSYLNVADFKGIRAG